MNEAERNVERGVQMCRLLYLDLAPIALEPRWTCGPSDAPAAFGSVGALLTGCMYCILCLEDESSYQVTSIVQ
jgi:hypothetical protein